jgi:hypothetical protein
MTMIERVARAILKARFYDCEPDMYNGLDGFYHEIDEEHVEDARREARAAIEAMRSAPEHLAADLRLDGQHIASYHDIIDAALNEQVSG